MKLTMQKAVPFALGIAACIAWISTNALMMAQGFTTTTVQGTVYVSNGQPASGVLQLSWPAFTTANNQAVAAGRTNVSIGGDGYVSVKLAPNLGSTPAGLYYTAVYHLSDGTTSTEYWVVPAAAQANLSQVRAQVMPAAQAVQAVSKGYVDQSITELTQSLLTASGGSLSGPLFLNGDPTQATQAATKRYVDNEFANALPVSGGAASGPLTSVQLGAIYQVDQFPGTDFGARLQACLNRLDPVYGGTCDARNFTGTQAAASAVLISTANATVQLPCATIATASQVIIAPGTRNVTLHGCASRGASDASGSQGGTVFLYSGSAPMVQAGDPSYAINTLGLHFDNAVINTTTSNSAQAQALAAYRTQEINLDGLYLLGNSNQTGMTLDGTGNYTGGTFQDIEFGGFGMAINAVGHQLPNAATTDWVNASAFIRLHINCPTTNGSPTPGSYGINLLQGDGNTFTGGDVEGCATVLHLGPNAQNNTIVGLRNENSTNQVVAEAGSSYNNWITGGTMFTGQLTDNGTRNSFLDTFHRSFNGLNGDWYGSQADTTITNHYRLGLGAGNERGLLNRYQTDSGYRWTMGLSDATSGEQFYQLLDELNNVYRLSIGQYNQGQPSSNNQTVINAAGTGAVVLNGSANAGTGGVIFGSGGSSGSAVATINNTGNAQFNGTLQVGGASTFTNSTTVKNQADAEIDSILWAGTSANQKESFTYKDYLGASQWYMVKDASNNWALNSAPGGLDSFKAYQSMNSGDTYINASNGTGHIRLNFESGAGAETDIYSGPNATLVAGFLGSTAIKFPGLAAGSGRNCLQIDNSGYISNTGSPCTTPGVNGTVNSGITGQVAYYTGNGTIISGTTSVPVGAGGTGATSASQALQNLGAQAAMPGVAPDGASGIAVSGAIAAKTATSSVNKVLNVQAPPYNAQCNLLAKSSSLSISSGNVTSGFAFASTDVNKYVVAFNLTQGAQTLQYMGQITSVSGGNATMTPIAVTGITYTLPTTVTWWEYGTNDLSSNTNGGVGSGISQVYTDAAASGLTIQFPATTCLTGTIVWTGQPFFGAGNTQTVIRGLPGQDVFQTPDGNTWAPPTNGTLVHDLTVQNDISVDASGSTHGNNTFPNRIAGTLGGKTNLVTPAISPGPIPFGTYNGVNLSCSGTINSGTLNQISFSGANCISANAGPGLQNLDSWRVIGAPITINGVGSGGANLVTTITAVSSDGTTLTFATPATNPGSNLSGTYLNPITDDPTLATFFLTIGNCGFAFPNSNGSAPSPNLTRFTFQNVFIQAVNGPWQGNHACGMFVQAPPYKFHLLSSTITGFYGDYIEALPTTNPNGSTWTGDTSAYLQTDFQFGLIPMIIQGGNHRTFNVNVYGGTQYQTMGPLWINPGSSATIDRMYLECGVSTGEIARYTGLYGINVVGGSLDQCQPYPHYVLWNASRSNVNAQINTLQIAAGANMNTFTNTSMNAANLTDNGWSNSVQTNGNSSPITTFARQFLVNRPVEPVGKLKGAFLTSGNSAASYLNADDLFTTCLDWSIANQSPVVYGTCVSDPTGTEIDHTYFQSAAATTIFDLLNNGGVTNMWTGSQRLFGSSVPRVKTTVYVLGECVGASTCSTTLTVKDGTTNSTITAGSMTFTGTWTLQSLQVDFSTTIAGDGLDFRLASWTNTGTGYNIAWIGIQPVNSDEHTWLANNGLPTSAGNIQVANPAAARLCTGPASGVTAGHIVTATGTNSACDLQDGGAIPAAVATAVPLWMQSYGDGSDGALNITSGTTNITSGVHYYTTCNISPGAIGAITSTALSGAPAILFCNTNATIAGTISYSQNTGASNGIAGNANFGGQGGGGGGGTAAGLIGASVNGAGGGAAGAASGGTGGNGIAASTQLQRLFLTFGSNNLGSQQCGGSSGGAGGTGAAAGGRGAGCIVIVSPSISFTGTCDVSGVNGSASAANNQGGGGGGAGGVCVLRSPSMTNSGTLTVTGGSGGSCGAFTGCGAGGTGAPGWSKVITQ